MLAKARHILVPTEKACQDLKTQIEGGADFATLAGEQPEVRVALGTSQHRANRKRPHRQGRRRHGRP